MKQFLAEISVKSNTLKRDENNNPNYQLNTSFYGNNHHSTSKNSKMVNEYQSNNKSSLNNQRILLKMASPMFKNMSRNIQNYLMPNFRNQNNSNLSTDFNYDSVIDINTDDARTHTSSPKSSQISLNTPPGGPSYLDLLKEYLSHTLFTPDEKLIVTNMIKNKGAKNESNIDLPQQHLLKLVDNLEKELAIEREKAQRSNVILLETRINLERNETLISILRKLIIRYQNSIEISKSSTSVNKAQPTPNQTYKIELLKAAGIHSSNTTTPKISSTYAVYTETNTTKNSFDPSNDRGEGGFNSVYIPKQQSSIGSDSSMNLTTDSNPQMVTNHLREIFLVNCNNVGLFDENSLKSMSPSKIVQCVDLLIKAYLNIKDKLTKQNASIDLLNKDVSALRTHYENVSHNISILVNYIFESIYDPHFLQNFQNFLTDLSKQWEVCDSVSLQENTREFMNSKYKSFCDGIENILSVAQRCINPEELMHLSTEMKQSLISIIEIVFKDLLQFVDQKINIDITNTDQTKNIPILDIREYHLSAEQLRSKLGTEYDSLSPIIDDFISKLFLKIHSRIQINNQKSYTTPISQPSNIFAQNEQTVVLHPIAENIPTENESQYSTPSDKLSTSKDISITVESGTTLSVSSSVRTQDKKLETNDSSFLNNQNDTKKCDMDLQHANVSDSNSKLHALNQSMNNLMELEHKLTEKEAEINRLKKLNMNKPFVDILKEEISLLDSPTLSNVPRENTNLILKDLKNVFTELKNALESANCETIQPSISGGVEVSDSVDKQNPAYIEFKDLITETVKNAKISYQQMLDLDFKFKNANGQLIFKNQELETAKESIQNLSSVIAEKDIKFNSLHEFYQHHMINSVNLQQQQFIQIQQESNELLELAKSLNSEDDNIGESSNVESNIESMDEQPSSEADAVNNASLNIPHIKKKPFVSTPGLDDSIRRAEEALNDIKQTKDEIINYNEKSHRYFNAYLTNLDRFKPKADPLLETTSPSSDINEMPNKSADGSSSKAKINEIKDIDDILYSIVDDDEEEDPLVS